MRSQSLGQIGFRSNFSREHLPLKATGTMMDKPDETFLVPAPARADEYCNVS